MNHIKAVVMFLCDGIAKKTKKSKFLQFRERIQISQIMNSIISQNQHFQIGQHFTQSFVYVYYIYIYTQTYSKPRSFRRYISHSEKNTKEREREGLIVWPVPIRLIRLLLRKRVCNLFNKGKPSNFVISLSERSITSYWSYFVI